MFVKPIKIGNIEILNNVFLAPMAGITDLPFRILCKKYGAGLVYTEMVSSKGIFYNDNGTKKLLDIDENERPVAVQIFGSDPIIMGKIANKVSEVADIIDINMGCPAPKVVKNMDGSRLMQNPKLVYEIVKEVVKNSKVPITVKIRKGWDNEHVNAVEVAKFVEQAGASAITVHGRTREQFYSGEADWDIIKNVKDAVNIPVIGNGDIVDGESAKRIFEYTNCDGIMIGRASNGNPWIFKEILEFLKTGEKISRPNIQEIKDTILLHLNMLVDYKGEYTAIREMRKHIGWYVKGLENASVIRGQINKIESLEELREYIKNI